MNLLANFFKPKTATAELPDIYPMSVLEKDFVNSDIEATYTKILTDTLERTHGIPEKTVPMLWDNCVADETQYGLVSLLVEAMVKQTDLCIVYFPSVNVVRKATSEEATKIKEDYKKSGSSSVGVYITFRNYHRTKMLRIYSSLEYCILASLNKTVNISKAVQIKISDLRKSVSLADEAVAGAQAQAIAQALKSGVDVYLDAADEITTAAPDVSPTERAISFLDAKRAFYLDLPLSYISGLQTAGIGSTGEADTKAIDRGLKQYFFSIIQPVLKALFNLNTTFKTQDFRQMESALELVKTFELVSDTLISQESKKEIIARVFDLDPTEEQKNLDREAAERGTSTTLNGAQVTAMSQFLAQLATGQLAPETAIQALIVSFNLSEEDAEAIVEPMQDLQPRQSAAPSVVRA